MKIKTLIWVLITLLSLENLTAKTIRPGKILKMIRRSAVLNEHFTGFALYDLDKRKMIGGQNSEKHFTPASNTKLFTFYAGLKLLKDSVAGLSYIERGDSLIFWGTADPSFLNRDFKQQGIVQKLNSSAKKLYWANGLFTGDFYGAGWTYDDYNEYYQPEMSELPVYGNSIYFRSSNNALHSYPEFNSGGVFTLLTDSVINSGRFRVKRNILSNEFHKSNISVPSGFSQTVPFKVSDELISKLLKQNIPAFSGSLSLKKPVNTKTWYSIPTDTLFRHMLLPSDNFIAEQILLNIAATNGMEMNTSVVIDYVIKNYLSDLHDKVQWVDGSGLSRQNLFTPRSMVRLCEKIYDEVGDENRLFDLLPQGGKTGTLKNLYKSDRPFVFAKTGSLSNNHNLSGYLVTRKGKKLIFSFMNNNYTVSTADVRSEMERIVTFINQNY
ncbi:D-alanyl-D-alanine carboxypeptidase / D-alanyl-D-alanine-endopeptidase (penicillin-binding protein 4) [Daejeonella rubra]|uniref:D-alanyl-D-alanine carboxypeptidase / D-alanyl-D-alanine-endopeptidase (Penicillin-binding protein 4) n=2 Tax=Daejeonella rubra TaxID=990371 RepID=A0A1G9RPK9_9SPHI|nr:D-alanyl-D-alanine carboxypeptidase / D-alanyl-D-alanine-endopeptidase (penicillin-binding protein 4) [Daejeonella rubra]